MRSRAATEVKCTLGDVNCSHFSQSTSGFSIQRGAFRKTVVDVGEYFMGAGALQPWSDDAKPSILSREG